MIVILIISVLVLSAVAFWQASLLFSSIVGAPTVYSNDSAMIDAFELAALKKGETLLDLGCGNARSLIIAAKKYGARGIGVEISPYCYLKSRFNVLRAGQNKNIHIYLGNLTKSRDLIKKADVIYLYLLNSVLAKIEDEIFDNIKPGCRVVALAFQFPNRKPQKSVSTINLGRKTKIYLYQ